MDTQTTHNKTIAIWAGLLGLIHIIHTYIFWNKAFTFLYSDTLPQKASNYLTIYLSVAVVGFFIAIIFLLKRKRWSLWLTQLLAMLVFIFIIKQLIMLNYSSFLGISAIFQIIAAYVIMRYCANKREFGAKIKPPKHPKLSKAFAWGVGIILALLVSYYATHYFIIFSKQKQIAKFDSNIIQNVKLKEYDILEYKLMLPDGLKVSYLSKGDYFEKLNLSLTNDDNSIRILLNLDPFNPMHEMFGYKHSYGLTKRMNRLTRFVTMFAKENLVFYEVDVNKDLDGFFTSFIYDKYKGGFWYQIYDKKDRSIDGQIMITDKNGLLSKEQWEGLINIIQLTSSLPYSEQAYLKRANDKYKNNQFEQAKFDVVNALSINWDNADSHLLLGKLFNDTNNLESAKSAFKESLRLNPNHTEAKKLVDNIKDNK